MDTSNRAKPELRDDLGRLRAALCTIGAIVAAAGIAQRAAAQEAADREQELRAILGCVALVEDRAGSGGPVDGPGFHVTEVSPDVLWVDVERARLQGHPLDVIVDVQASAQLGGLLLSFGASHLFSNMTLRVAGNGGVRELVLSSGTSLTSVAAAINAVGSSVGVGASLSQTSVRAESLEMGSDRFVSVRVMSIDRVRPGSGIYRLHPDDFGTPVPASRIPLDSRRASHWVADIGQDIDATVNGRPAQGVGPALRVRSAHLRAQFELTVGEPSGTVNAQTLGEFRAFRIVPGG